MHSNGETTTPATPQFLREFVDLTLSVKTKLIMFWTVHVLPPAQDDLFTLAKSGVQGKLRFIKTWVLSSGHWFDQL